MRGNQKFFVCKHCGNLVGMINNGGVSIICCGEEMKELVANTSDGAKEKHVHVVEIDGNKVTVNIGSIDHPMLPEHHIEFIYLETEKGGQRKSLEVGGAPRATFVLKDDKPLAVYEYCNLHGLWKAEIAE